MRCISASAARAQLYALLDEAASSHEPIQINGKRTSAILIMKSIWRMFLKVVVAGGWAPLLVFATDLFIDPILDVYQTVPWIDTPLHFLGGLSIAFFVSKCFRALPRESIRRSRIVVLELLLAGCITVTAAVFWEFAEFTIDAMFGGNLQVSLADTMKDLALGVAGAIVFIVLRSRQLRAGAGEVRELAFDWVRGEAV